MTPAQSDFRFLANYGKSGALGCFHAEEALALARGERVVVDTGRGLEVAIILCPASSRPSQLFETPGKLLRRLGADDDVLLHRHADHAQKLFDAARLHAQNLGLPVEILDAEILFDGNHAILQLLGTDHVDLAPLIDALEADFALEVRCENLAHDQPESPAERGCGKPDCGKTSEGSCSSCSSGSCSSCGSSAAPDLRPYFAHLREKMEAQRTPLL